MFTTTLGCGDSIVDGGRPVLEAYDGTRPVLENGLVSVSAQRPTIVLLKNTGFADLVISDMTITSNATDAFGMLSLPMPLADEPLVIVPGGTHEISLLFDSANAATVERPSATVTLATNQTLSGARTFSFRVSPEASSGRLQASPSKLDFKEVQASQTKILPLTLVNVGSANLEVTRFVMSGHTGYEITIAGVTYPLDATSSAGIDLPAPLTLGISGSVELEVKYTASGPEEAEASLIFYSNDPTSTAGLVVPMFANVAGPCITVTPENVDFGGKLVGQQARIDVQIESCGEGDLELEGIELTDDAGGVYTLDTSALGAFPLAVPHDEKRTVGVVYLPTATAVLGGDGEFVRDLGKMKVLSNGYLAEIEVDLSGFGTDGSCPTPVITCSEGDEVIPQTTMHCSASASTASTGSITAYQWRIRQPNGSNEAIRPSTTQRDIQFTANIIGTYVFELDVFDQFGTKSCAPAEYQVFVTSGEAIHVELIWRTPGDINETDTGTTLGGLSVGSDVDLHVLHPNATNYFDDNYDCYWFAKNPNWAGAGALDDPRLDRDDTDGAGPENFNLNQPQFNTTYLVGAHYWDDWGYGAALTTVRVYVYGQLRFTWNDVNLIHHDMWDVCEIEWPTGNVTAIGGNTPSIRGDYPIPF